MLVPAQPIKFSYTDLFKARDPFTSGILQRRLVSDRMLHFASGGLALYHACRHLGLGVGARMLLPAYICQSAVLPFAHAGLDVAYYDASPGDAGVAEQLAAALEKFRPRAVLVVDYFGVTPRADNVLRLCKDHGTKVIDDKCHCLLRPSGQASGDELSPDAIVYSQRKVLPVPDGGFLILRDVQNGCEAASRNERMQHFVRNLIERVVFGLGVPNPYGRLKDIRRGASSSGEEGDAEGDASAMVALDVLPSRILCRFLRDDKELARISQVRRANYERLLAILSALGYQPLAAKLPATAVPQGLPVRADESLCAWLRARGVGAYLWPGDELPIPVRNGDFPIAKELARSVVVLPVHQEIRPAHIDAMARALSDWPGREARRSTL